MAAQTCTEWRPKPRQKRILEAAQRAGFNRTITTICEEAKVPRRTFYYWLEKDSGFADAWDAVWRCAITRHMPAIVAAMAAKARKGDVAAARLVADIAGVIRHKHDVTTTGTIMELSWGDDYEDDQTSEASQGPAERSEEQGEVQGLSSGTEMGED